MRGQCTSWKPASWLPACFLKVLFKACQPLPSQMGDFRDPQLPGCIHTHPATLPHSLANESQSLPSGPWGLTCVEAFWSICPTGLNNADSSQHLPSTRPVPAASFTGLAVGCPTREMECARLLNTTAVDCWQAHAVFHNKSVPDVLSRRVLCFSSQPVAL